MKDENSVALELDRKKFAKLKTGETVRGFVSIVLSKPTQSQAISLKLTTQPGDEWARELGGKVKQEYRKGGRIFEIVIPLDIFNARSMTGQFRFPFEFAVPPQDPEGHASTIKLPSVALGSIQTARGESVTDAMFPVRIRKTQEAQQIRRNIQALAIPLESGSATFNATPLLDPQSSQSVGSKSGSELPSPRHKAVRFSIVERPVLLFIPELKTSFAREWQQRLASRYAAEARRSIPSSPRSKLARASDVASSILAVAVGQGAPAVDAVDAKREDHKNLESVSRRSDTIATSDARRVHGPEEPERQAMRFARTATPMYLTESMWKSGSTVPGAPQMHIPIVMPSMVVHETRPSPLARIGRSGVNTSQFKQHQTVQTNGAFVMGLPALSQSQTELLTAESATMKQHREDFGFGTRRKEMTSSTVGVDAGGGHVDICCEVKTNVCMPGANVQVVVSMQNKSEYHVRRVYVEVVKRKEMTSSLLGSGEKLSINREFLVNQNRFDHVKDFIDSTALVTVKLPPFIDPEADYFIQARVELNDGLNPVCRVPLSFSHTPSNEA